jgi:phytoene dehydrogenase-like protein
MGARVTEAADAVVIGSGPNGLVAAAMLAGAGWRVAVVERAPVAGGAVRSEELTLPGFVHDSFSAFYGLLHSSPVFAELALDTRVPWATFAVPVAAAVGPEEVALCHAAVRRTEDGLACLDPGDGRAWSELYGWWCTVGVRVFDVLVSPLPSPRPTARLLRAVGIRGGLELLRTLVQPVDVAARDRFASLPAQALLAAGTTHSDVGVDQAGSVPLALVLAMVAQGAGMPVPVGGAGRLAGAMVRAVEEAGGTVRTGQDVTRVILERGRAAGVETAQGWSLRARRAVLADVGPPRLFGGLVGEDAVPPSYLEGIRRFRYGSGIFKLDLALDGAVPWVSEGLRGCGVVHLTGDLDAMARAAGEVRRGLLPAEPLLIVGQQSQADPTRAPPGSHTLWVETHVPASPRGDGAGSIGGAGWTAVAGAFRDRVLDRLERHAPGLLARVAAQATRTPPDLEAENPNLVGGDLGGGSMALDQQAVLRPVPGWFRYATPVKGLYLCSASAHPGGGVHGMVGRNCARRVLADARLRRI